MVEVKFDYADNVKIGYDVGHCTTISNIAYYASFQVTPHSDGEVEPIEVLNYVEPLGYSGRHKVWQIVLGIDSDDYEAFYTQQVQSAVAASRAIKDNEDNYEIEYFVVTLKDSSGNSITHTFTSGKVSVMSVSSVFSNEPNKEYQITEYILQCWGERVTA